jgi:hypothetical protein
MAVQPKSKVGVSGAGVKQAVKRPMFRIETVQRRERFLKALVYGNYGVGKTTLACSALEVPSMQDVLIINAESGDLSVDHMEGLDSITVDDFKTLGQINEFLKQHCRARDEGDTDRLRQLETVLRGVEEDEIEEPRQYKTVVIDSLSELEAYCFNQLLGITDSTRLDEETQAAEWGEYKKNNTMILRVVRAFRDLPMNVIFTCGEKYTQDETKKFKYVPDMTGQLAKKIQGFMDMVGYYVMGKAGDDVQRRLYVMPSGTGRYDAKHRYQSFKGEFFTDPTIGTILKEVGLLNPDGTALK